MIVVTYLYPNPNGSQRPRFYKDIEAVKQSYSRSEWIQLARGEWLLISRGHDVVLLYLAREEKVYG